MRITKISQGGQVQVPAEVRRRWGTRRVVIDDAGDHIRIRPVPDDPISTAAGSLAPSALSSDEMARRWRDEDLRAEEQKWARHYADDRP